MPQGISATIWACVLEDPIISMQAAFICVTCHAIAFPFSHRGSHFHCANTPLKCAVCEQTVGTSPVQIPQSEDWFYCWVRNPNCSRGWLTQLSWWYISLDKSVCKMNNINDDVNVMSAPSPQNTVWTFLLISWRVGGLFPFFLLAALQLALILESSQASGSRAARRGLCFGQERAKGTAGCCRRPSQAGKPVCPPRRHHSVGNFFFGSYFWYNFVRNFYVSSTAVKPTAPEIIISKCTGLWLLMALTATTEYDKQPSLLLLSFPAQIPHHIEFLFCSQLNLLASIDFPCISVKYSGFGVCRD